MLVKPVDTDLPPPPPELDPREPPAPSCVPHRTPSRAHHHATGSPAGVAHPHPGRSARSSPVGSRATSPSPAIGSPLGVIGRDREQSASGSTGIVFPHRDSNVSVTTGTLPTPSSSPPLPHHSAPHSPSAMIFERDVTVIPPPMDLTHKPSRLSSPAPHHHHLHHAYHHDSSDGKVPTVLDDAIEALASVSVSSLSDYGTGSGLLSGSGIAGTPDLPLGERIEIEGPVSAINYRTRPSTRSTPVGQMSVASVAASAAPGAASSGQAAHGQLGSGERSPVSDGQTSPGSTSPLSAGGNGPDESLAASIMSPRSHRARAPGSRPGITTQESTGPSLPGAFPSESAPAATPGSPASAGSGAKDWKRKIKEWVGPRPGPGVFPDDVEEEEAVAKDGTVVDLGDGQADATSPNHTDTPSHPQGPLLAPPPAGVFAAQSQPMTPTSSHSREKRRISFVSYNDLLQSVPTTISPLSEIANGHIEPDHLPGTVSPVRAGSPFRVTSVPAQPVQLTSDPRAMGMKRGSEPNLGLGVRGRTGSGLAADDTSTGAGTRERSTSTFQREGLGKGLTERLEMLIGDGE